MKSIIALAAVAAVAAVAAPAMAASAYGTLGYTQVDEKIGATSYSFPTVEGRLGARFNPYLALEAQANVGIGNSHNVRVDSAVSGYVVGLWPVMANADVFIRGGYGRNTLRASGSSFGFTTDSWNYGVGGQYFFNGGKNGVRVDYTRVNFSQSGFADANTWGVSYVRKF